MPCQSVISLFRRALIIAGLLGCCVPRGLEAQSVSPAATSVIVGDEASNRRAQRRKHYVVLVSLDGFRYDYPTKWGAPHIAALQNEGATARAGMFPSYPSLTFPNHIALVTGLVPEHSGIVANTFFDPARGASYSYKSAETNSDGTWYSGTPLWSLAEQQGMRAASFFWPGSEAEIAGKRPSYYVHFDDKFSDEGRIDQIIDWLHLPAAKRPHLITLYYSNTDHAGHEYGPDSNEERDAVHHVDQLIGDLHAKLAATHLPIDLIVLADHGMARTEGGFITLDHYADLTHFTFNGALLYPETEADAARAYAEFESHPDPRFSVYRRADVPASLRYNENPREGDPVIVPNGPFAFQVHEGTKKPSAGEHGYDPRRMPEMKALFVAVGPDIRAGVDLPSFQNVDVYDLVCRLLKLKPAANDGGLAPVAAALKHP